MDYVHIWASDVKPPIASGWAFGHMGYGRECGFFAGTPESGMPTEFECEEDAIGRYGYLWFETTQYSHVCEVEIYGLRKYMLCQFFNQITNSFRESSFSMLN